MKISKTKLHQIIKEELRRVLGEGRDDLPPGAGSTKYAVGRIPATRPGNPDDWDKTAAFAAADIGQREKGAKKGPWTTFVPAGEKAEVDFRAGPTHRSAADVAQAFADRELGINDEFEADDAVRQTYNLPNGWQDDPDIEPKKMRFYMDQYEKLLSKLRSAEFDR